ncbi:hypothetical protein NLU13_1204 [Sarocladium strictum]|uniref:Uncharacterized protein n=1 Tax=Sarocladium strictum TaxID=5046 RepID=A0AA39GQI0_SARSR|nr:hypothetical protein NLU13_1204 [Sarocladium strictum]
MSAHYGTQAANKLRLSSGPITISLLMHQSSIVARRFATSHKLPKATRPRPHQRNMVAPEDNNHEIGLYHEQGGSGRMSRESWNVVRWEVHPRSRDPCFYLEYSSVMQQPPCRRSAAYSSIMSQTLVHFIVSGLY